MAESNVENCPNYYFSDLSDDTFYALAILIGDQLHTQPLKQNIDRIGKCLSQLGFSIQTLDLSSNKQDTNNIDLTQGDKILNPAKIEIEKFKFDNGGKLDFFILYFSGEIIDDYIIMHNPEDKDKNSTYTHSSICATIEYINFLCSSIPKLYLYDCNHYLVCRDSETLMTDLCSIPGKDYLLAFSTQLGHNSLHEEVSWWTDQLCNQFEVCLTDTVPIVDILESITIKFQHCYCDQLQIKSKLGKPFFINKLTKCLQFPQFEEPTYPLPLSYPDNIFLLYASDNEEMTLEYIIKFITSLERVHINVECDLIANYGNASQAEWVYESFERCKYTIIIGSPLLRDILSTNQNSNFNKSNNKSLQVYKTLMYSIISQPEKFAKILPVKLFPNYGNKMDDEDIFPTCLAGKFCYPIDDFPNSDSQIRFSMPISGFTRLYCHIKGIKLERGKFNPKSSERNTAINSIAPRKIIKLSIDNSIVPFLDKTISTNQIGIIAEDVSRHLQRGDWKFLARNLGLKESQIAEIEHDNEQDGLHEVKVQMLISWQKSSAEATFRKLCLSLKSIQCAIAVMCVYSSMRQLFLKNIIA